ncbi:hypothetical protein [Sediminicoccus rosea]|uniref:Aerotolerance regulator N-terminal domain-containing protein n=1 Tax=Sediminicoccus rosea TaxID=1225128 RepID=A0ABZ0PNR2_9PROT|nr:hypothetical protein [Sediminicoccus rosea]WPB86963.1 hypothetical protein R9Z33_08820 [Sediminicoccus rosea]
MHLLLDPTGARLVLFLLALAVAPLVLMMLDRRRREGGNAARRGQAKRAWAPLAWAAAQGG